MKNLRSGSISIIFLAYICPVRWVSTNTRTDVTKKYDTYQRGWQGYHRALVGSIQRGHTWRRPANVALPE